MLPRVFVLSALAFASAHQTASSGTCAAAASSATEGYWAPLRGRRTQLRELVLGTAADAERPLLSLVMIVKDEAGNIGDVVDSVKGVVDTYSILDTGSSDDTVRIIRERFGSTPGEIHREPFVDFATTRNRALELAGTRSVFRLMLSGDEQLQHGATLRAFCERRRAWRLPPRPRADGAHGTLDGAFRVRVQRRGGKQWYMPFVTRSDARWFYRGVTHEYLTDAFGSSSTDVDLVQAGGATATVLRAEHSDMDNKFARWRLDAQLLRREFERAPAGGKEDDARTCFYLAQSHHDLDDWAPAYEWYMRRVAMVGEWGEETYVAATRAAEVAAELPAGTVEWSAVQDMLLRAQALVPDRAEALHAIARHYYMLEPENWELCFLFARQAFDLPFPEHRILFVLRAVYTVKIPDMLSVCALNTGRALIGLQAAQQALENDPGNERIRRNVAYARRAHKAAEAARAARRTAGRQSSERPSVPTVRTTRPKIDKTS